MRKRTADFLQGTLIERCNYKSQANTMQFCAEQDPRQRRRSARQPVAEPSRYRREIRVLSELEKKRSPKAFQQPICIQSYKE
jgi:hypothetical protein